MIECHGITIKNATNRPCQKYLDRQVFVKRLSNSNDIAITSGAIRPAADLTITVRAHEAQITYHHF